MTQFSQVQQLADIGVDYAGFIFYEKSPRFVGDKIKPAELKQWNGLQKVGVFVNEVEENMLRPIETYGLNAVQLHGDETPEFCNRLQSVVKVIKVFRINGNESIEEITASYKGVADYFLFDTKAKEYGGTGKKFNWEVLGTSTLSKPYFLSGGIGVDDVELIQQYIDKAVTPPFAIDINSRFELDPGIKNIQLIQAFIANLSNRGMRSGAGDFT